MQRIKSAKSSHIFDGHLVSSRPAAVDQVPFTENANPKYEQWRSVQNTSLASRRMLRVGVGIDFFSLENYKKYYEATI